MRKFIFHVLMFCLMVMLMPTAGLSDEGADPYSGDLLARSTLTGDWGGLRSQLAAKGVTFDFNITQTWQGITNGGKDDQWEYGGRGLFTFNVDTQKLGWWPGGFLTVEAEGNWEEGVNANTGALMPVNTNQLYPLIKEEIVIPAVRFTQFLSGNFGIFLGKLDTTSGDMNEFAHGKGDDQFLNLAFNVNPVIIVAAPYSTLGGGAVILPVAANPDAGIISLVALSADGKPNTTGFDDLANGNNVYIAEGRVRTDFFQHTGHQLLGAGYSTKNFTSLDQDLRFILPNQEIAEEDHSWFVFYNFDQYIYEETKGSGKGIGVFGRFGVSDGNPNPMEFFFSIGLGGKGFFPQRPHDGFGIGYYYIDVNQPRLTGPVTDRLFLRDEYGFEAYYDIGLTPWMHLMPDIQIIRGAQKYERGTGIGNRTEIDTAVVLGARLKMVF